MGGQSFTFLGGKGVYHQKHRVLVPQPGLNPRPLQWKQSLNHWTTRRAPQSLTFGHYACLHIPFLHNKRVKQAYGQGSVFVVQPVINSVFFHCELNTYLFI